MELLGDILFWLLVLVALWKVLPRHTRIRVRGGLGPAVEALAQLVRDVTIPIKKGLTVVAYRGLLGKPAPPSITVKQEEAEEEETPAVSPLVTASTVATTPIAINSSVYSGELSQLEFETRAKILAEFYQQGMVTNLSKAICKAYGCSVQSSSKPESTYQRALAEVNKHLPKGPQFMQEDGTRAPATHPISGKRTAA